MPRWGLRLRASAAVFLDPALCSNEKSNSARRACQRAYRPKRSFLVRKWRVAMLSVNTVNGRWRR